MPYRLDNTLFESLLALPSDQRYRHFLEKVADWEELWSIRDEQGWLVQASKDGQPFISLWPHPEFAKDAIKRHYPGNFEEEIDFEFLLKQWLPLLKSEGIKVSLFPNREGHSVLLDTDRFEADLRRELNKLSSDFT